MSRASYTPAVTVRIDPSAHRIEVSVGDLVADPEARAIGLSAGGTLRARLGGELHRLLQRELAAEPGYTAEVPVRRELEVDGWSVAVSGRTDGVLLAGGRPVRVDEIKTLHFATELHGRPDRSRLERYRNQLRLYAYLLATSEAEPAARLILVDITTGERRQEEVPWSRRAVAAWLRSAVHRLLAAHAAAEARRRRAERLARELPFPHPEWRPGQREIAEAVARALAEGRPALIQAPTGIGKTAAALHPALRHALAHGHRVWYLTAKTMQQRIAVETVRAMGGRARTLRLRAKARMCAHHETICHEAVCPYAEGYSAKLARTGLLERLVGEGGHIEPDPLFEVARAAGVCPFELSLDLIPAQDAVICDYNYVFAPGIGLPAVAGAAAAADAILIVDEAHNLVDRARGYYSPVLELGRIERALEHLDRLGSRELVTLRHALLGLASWLEDVLETALGPGRSGERLAEPDPAPLGELRLELDAGLLRYVLLKRERELWLEEDPALEAARDAIRFHEVLALGGEEFARVARRTRDRAELAVVCCDPSRFLAPTIEAAAGFVAMSATLQPFEYTCDLLGIRRAEALALSVPSPFPPENRLVVAIPDVDTRYRRRRATADRAAAWIARVAAPDRNTMVLAPSYAYLRLLLERLPPVPQEVLVQEPDLAPHRRRELLERLRAGGGHLLFAVLGGMFAEGVDYPGEMLSEVIVVSPALPQVCLERQLLAAYLEERYGQGFAYAYLIPGMTRVIQAAGRLIRSAEDRGAIVLLGRRFLERPYVDLLPEEWTGGDPSSLVVDDPEAAVREFFAAYPSVPTLPRAAEP